MFSSRMYLDLPCGAFASGFPTQTVYAHLFSTLNATCPPYLSLDWLDHPKIHETTCCFLQPHVNLMFFPEP